MARECGNTLASVSLELALTVASWERFGDFVRLCLSVRIDEPHRIAPS